MNKIGFVISKKENEKRRAIVIKDLLKIKNKKFVYFEKGYFDILNDNDNLVKEMGFNVAEREFILKKCDIIIDPKVGDAEYLEKLYNKITFGWIHATQNYNITQKYIDNKLTGYAWEKMYEENRHIFFKNNELAGEAAVLHAMISYGKSFSGLNIAVLGNGNCATGAIKILNKIGANVTIYNHIKENLFKKEFFKYDVIVNCILWDISRRDHIINEKDLLKMEKGSLIIDISCDKNGGIQSSVPTTIENPIYEKSGVIHYVVDHTPSLLFRNASIDISKEVCKYVDEFIEGKESNVLKEALIIKDGKIIDSDINKFQNR